MVVLDPGQQYTVSVVNIPKPELGHSSYDVSTDVIVPGESKSNELKKPWKNTAQRGVFVELSFIYSWDILLLYFLCKM